MKMNLNEIQKQINRIEEVTDYLYDQPMEFEIEMRNLSNNNNNNDIYLNIMEKK
jgi:hypothetical protein